jgi:hypothetical protein
MGLGWLGRGDARTPELIEAFELIMAVAAFWFVCQGAVEAFG